MESMYRIHTAQSRGDGELGMEGRAARRGPDTGRPAGAFAAYRAAEILKIAHMWDLLGHPGGTRVHCFAWNIKVIKLNGRVTGKLYETLGDLQSNRYVLQACGLKTALQ